MNCTDPDNSLQGRRPGGAMSRLAAIAMLAAMTLCACDSHTAPSPADEARIKARNDARTIINREWPDSISRAEAVQALRDSAKATFDRSGHPGLTAPYDSTLTSTLRAVTKKQRPKKKDKMTPDTAK